MNCKNCGNPLNGAKFCAACGTAAEEAVSVQPVAGQPQPMNQAVQMGQPSTLPSDSMGIAGFVCGIIGSLCCTYIAIPGLICSIISMNNVKAGKVNPKNKWMGIVGLILSIIGILMLVINLIGILNGSNDVYNSIVNN